MNKELWKQLYDVFDSFVEKEAWNNIYAEDFIQLYDKDENVNYYCSIMGRLGECIGLSIYKGQYGLADFFSISREYPDQEIIKFIMFDQTCLTFYLGEKEEVPQEQLEMMKDLKKKYKKGQYPYFLSFKPHYFPYTLNDDEVKMMIKVVNHLLKTVTKYINNEIDVKVGEQEIIYTTINSDEYEAIAYPQFFDKYHPVILYDDIIEEAKKCKYGEDSYVFDLNYLSNYIEDDEFERPAQSLIFIIYNESLDEIHYLDLLDPRDDEIDAIVTMLLQLCKNEGIPENIYFRNPKVYQACAHLCDELDIDLTYMDLEFLDDMYEQLDTYLEERE